MKPRLSFWQIWNMSFGFLGIQFGFALQNANVSRIFETLGADIDAIPILWIAAPVTGLIIQPIIGHMSDKTWNRLGRRRPYFLSGAILASTAIIFMPNSPALWIAAGMLWIMDASINISMEPFRAFVADNLPSEQRTIGYSMQSFFIGIGAVIASALPYILTNWFNITNTAPAGEIPDSVKFSFYFGGAVFFLAVLWTVISSKEYSPEELKSFSEYKRDVAGSSDDKVPTDVSANIFFRNGFIWLVVGLIGSVILHFVLNENDFGLYVLFIGLFAFGIVQIIAGLLTKSGKIKNGFVVVTNDLYRMPTTMRQLAIVQFFSWFALFAMWIYTTAAVTSTHYDLKLDKSSFSSLQAVISQNLHPDTLKNWKDLDEIKTTLNNYDKKFKSGDDYVNCNIKVASFFKDSVRASYLKLDNSTFNKMIYIDKQYNQGADWVGVLMSVYNGFAAVMAFILVWLAKKTNRKSVHMISLMIGGLAFVSFYVIQDPKLLLISELGIGLAWASILAMPYAILAGSIPPEKMGVYMGIFNFFIVIPQITAAAILGWFVRVPFAGEAIYALLLGGFSMILAGIMVMFVKDVDEVKG
jgi:MFS family permease